MHGLSETMSQDKSLLLDVTSGHRDTDVTNLDGWIDEWIDEWMGDGMGGWIGGWVDG